MKVTVFKSLKYVVFRMLLDKITPVLAISYLLQYIPSEQFVSSNVRYDTTGCLRLNLFTLVKTQTPVIISLYLLTFSLYFFFLGGGLLTKAMFILYAFYDPLLPNALISLLHGIFFVVVIICLSVSWILYSYLSLSSNTFVVR